MKKLLIIGFLVITHYASGQLPTQLAPLILHKNIPLLFEFKPKQNAINIYGLTQSWIEVNEALRLRAKNSIDFVTYKVLRKIKEGTIKRVPGEICACVMDADGCVHEYDKLYFHTNYFQQLLVEMQFGQATPRVSLPSIQKIPLQVKGSSYAKK